MSEIRLRAIARIGQISKELQKSEQSKGGRHNTSVKPTKTEQLAAAGLNPMTANRYEELAAPNAQLEHGLQGRVSSVGTPAADWRLDNASVTNLMMRLHARTNTAH
jgi:hypothetical protein